MILNELNYKSLCKIILIIMIVNLFISARIFKLFYTQSEIVFHDYGQVFETIEDWKIWRIEHNK